ncbi:MAG: hypothetical protein Q8N47_12350 [Bryobacterales bacterium]|nr:hypothetical protein [Bryobacterales bacterium]
MFYRVGQVAEKLGISNYEMRHLCEAGLVRAERTQGGQWQVPVSEVERLKQSGVPPIPHPIRRDEDDFDPGDEQPSRAMKLPSYASVETVEAYDEAVRLRAEIDSLELKKRKELALDFFRERRRTEEERQLAASAAEKRRREEERDRIRKAEEEQRQVERQRRRVASWVDWAVRQVCEAPSEYTLTVKVAVTDLFESMPTGLSEDVVGSLVGATIQEVLAPWHQSERRTRAINRAAEKLLWRAKGWSTPTAWQRSAAEAAALAIDEVCPAGTEEEMVIAAERAVDQINKAFEHSEILESVLRCAWMKPEEFAQVTEKLKQQPIGTARRQLEKIRGDILESLRKAEGK